MERVSKDVVVVGFGAAGACAAIEAAESGAEVLVLDRFGGGIPGLYADGRTAAGVCSNSYVSGLSLADCVFSSRRAGRSAAVPRP